MTAYRTGHRVHTRAGGKATIDGPLARRLAVVSALSFSVYFAGALFTGPPALADEPASRAIELADSRHGATVRRIDSSSPAASLLRAGDRILAVDGHTVRRAADVQSRVATLGPGEPVLFEIARGRRILVVGVQLTAAPPRRAPAPETTSPPPTAPATAPTTIVVAPSPPPPVVVVVTAPAAPVYGGGFGFGPWIAPHRAGYPASSLPQIPGATMPPGPGTSAYAYPQIPGVAQPPIGPFPPGFTGPRMTPR